MKSRNKEKEKEKNKLMNNLIYHTKNNQFNNSNIGYIKVNKANEYITKNKNKPNNDIHLKSKSFICNYNKTENENNKYNRTINIVDNIKNNKYLIPMIENKNIEKKVCREKLKEAPLDILDILSKVRQKSERNRKEYNLLKNNNINVTSIHRYNNSSDKINNNNNYNNYNKYDLKTYYVNRKYISNKMGNNYSQNLPENNTYNFNSINDYIVYNHKSKNIKNKINYLNNKEIFNKSHDIYDLPLFNNYTYVQDNSYQSNNEERVIYPKVYNNNDSYTNNSYLKYFNPQIYKEDLKIDFENYLYNKKLFLIYRAKLFNLLYKNLSKYYNKLSHELKYFAFQKIKKYQFKNKIYKGNLTHRLHPRKTFISKNIIKINNTKINKSERYNNSKIRIKERINNRINDSMTSCRSFVQFIRKKNESESKSRGESSELYRNINNLKEKHEELQKRKNFKEYQMSAENLYKNKLTNLFIKNKYLFDIKNSTSRAIYKRKKLDDNSDRVISAYNTIKVKKNDKNIENRVTAYLKKKVNNVLEIKKKKGDNNPKYKITKNKCEIINKNKSNKLNNYFIRKMIKNIKSPDKRLFVNINYIYLNDNKVIWKKGKYSNDNLKIINSDNISFISNRKKFKNKRKINKEKLIGIIEEDESSNFNCTHDSINSFEYGNSKSFRNIYSKSFSNSNNKSTIANDKYLYSCIKFIYITIRRIILQNSYNLFKKRINFEKCKINEN